MLENLNKSNYLKTMFYIAIPITLQVLLQSSLSVIDQIMIGSLGEASIAGIGFAWRLPTIYIFSMGAISGACSIIISQFFGKKEKNGLSIAFTVLFIMGLLLTLVFFIITLIFPDGIISLFTKDQVVISIGSKYLRIITWYYIPSFIISMLSAYLRSIGKVIFPTITSILSVIVNTILNYTLIFGRLGFKELGINGAAIATIISISIQTVLILIYFFFQQRTSEYRIKLNFKITKSFVKSVFIITIPLLVCEFLWSLGESTYQVIYGHIGTNQSAAMNLIGPIVSLSIGLFSGVSQATSIMVGNRLGANNNQLAYFIAKKFILFGLIGTLIIGGGIISLKHLYSRLYNIEPSTIETLQNLLVMFAIVLWIKVSNMILGGIIRSGGKTKYVMFMDIIGTWFIGVPSGFLAAFVFNLKIEWVYLIISFEELVRLIIGVVIFSSKRWIKNIEIEGEKSIEKNLSINEII